MATEVYKFEEMTSAQAGKFITYNENLRRLEGLTSSILSRSNGGPPVTPAEGAAYIVDVASGDWSSFTVDSIAHYYLGTWKNYLPPAGLRLTLLDEGADGVLLFYTGTIWTNLITASLGIGDWQVLTTNTTIASGDRVFVDLTSNAITITLPAVPTLGQSVEIADITDAAAITLDETDNILTINNNGLKIEGVLDTVESQFPGKVFKLTYSNAAYGWKLFK